MIYFIILLWSCLLSGVLSMGTRGAAERALYFSGYVIEEAYLDADSREIATGCLGTRVGLRGQANRCTLKEFCEHLWSQATEADGRTDQRPDPKATWWSQEVRLSATKGLKNHNPENMRDWIMRVRLKKPGEMNNDINPRTDNLPKHGYYGPVAIGNLIQGGNQQNYFQIVGDIGERIANAQKHYAAHKDEVDKDTQTAFKEWFERAELAADDAITLRRQDEAKNWKKKLAQQLRRDFPEDDPRRKQIQITTKTVTGDVEGSTVRFTDVDVDATARDLAGPLRLTEDEIKNRIYDILRAEQDSAEYRSHQEAINALKRALRSIECVKTGSTSGL